MHISLSPPSLSTSMFPCNCCTFVPFPTVTVVGQSLSNLFPTFSGTSKKREGKAKDKETTKGKEKVDIEVDAEPPTYHSPTITK